MPFVITEACINEKVADCVNVCPVDCIVEGDDQFFINPDVCIDCGACEVECPVSAVFYEEDLPEHYLKYIDKTAEFFRTK
ncbi:indolepyruvate ferredoxin oxidoreductase subunit alpha [Paenibacillus sp. NPDC058177]|uniref:indolepyruvate ferredoxin oxidoreductase subunit alpha n=1 Tax=Paenibacillus sp. NPDC058177 TaxID=3346369 RepID=UPI0036DB9057